LGEREFVVDTGGSDAVVPRVEIDCVDTVGLRQSDSIVRFSERCIVACLGNEFVNHVRIEGAGVGETLSTIDDQANTDTSALGDRQRLDPSTVHPHLGSHG
jgi:hypothetical protein